MTSPISEQAWHALDPESVARKLAVDPALGLAAEAVTARLQTHGHNRLAEKTPRPAWLKFLDQFRSLLVDCDRVERPVAGGRTEVAFPFAHAKIGRRPRCLSQVRR